MIAQWALPGKKELNEEDELASLPAETCFTCFLRIRRGKMRHSPMFTNRGAYGCGV